MAKNGIIHKAVRKAQCYVGRIVYVVRDTLGKMHFVLALRHRGWHGKVLARCFWCPGFLRIVRG